MNIKRSRDPVSHTANPNHNPEARVVAIFGAGRLVQKSDGRHELVGGTAANEAEAREWCSLFAHEIVFSTDNEAASPSLVSARATARPNAGKSCAGRRHRLGRFCRR